MTEFNDNFNINDYDIVLFDMWGVLYNGGSYPEESKKTIDELRKAGKKVYIVSNTTERVEDVREKLRENGIEVDGIITSSFAGTLKFKPIIEKNEWKKVYIFGDKELGAKALSDICETGVEIVENPEEADFMYISNPRKKQLEESDNPECYRYDGRYYQLVSIEGRKEELDDLIILRKPFLNYNTDRVSVSKDQKSGEQFFPLIQGTMGHYIKENGENVQIYEYGKPNKEIYEPVIEEIEEKTGKKVNPKKVAMVGDTVGTDMLGAHNMGFDSIFFNGGVSGTEMRRLNMSSIEYFARKGQEFGVGVNFRPTAIFNDITDFYDNCVSRDLGQSNHPMHI